ncbi:MAG: PIG-L deacetylase family protein [Christensenellales bacterium]|jgi:LmbE family N-acetylglucosaminyl deacetylase
MGEGKRMLLLGAYSMEVVECGGALCRNVEEGGVSHAAIAFAGLQMREDLKVSAEILGVSLEFLNMDNGRITASYEEKLAVISVIRKFRPDIIITQDPEHCISDLDPGRRPFMTLVLEAISLAGREYAIEECGGFEPSGGAAIYYMLPENANCVVDIFKYWDKKCAAMDALNTQLEYFGKREGETPEQLERRRMLVPEWESLATDLERGRRYKKEMDKAFYMYPASTGHCSAMFAEPYRREGYFVLPGLIE